MLAKPASEISVGDILRALEGSLDPVDCAGLPGSCGCTSSGGCVTKYVWQKINESINQTVDGMNLEELIRETESENTPVVNSGACKN